MIRWGGETSPHMLARPGMGRVQRMRSSSPGCGLLLRLPRASFPLPSFPPSFLPRAPR